MIGVEFLSVFPAMALDCRANLSSEKEERSFSSKINLIRTGLKSCALESSVGVFPPIIQFQKLLYTVFEPIVIRPISLKYLMFVMFNLKLKGNQGKNKSNRTTAPTLLCYFPSVL